VSHLIGGFVLLILKERTRIHVVNKVLLAELRA